MTRKKAERNAPPFLFQQQVPRLRGDCTEVNIRHMAYTGVMARMGFDLIEDTIKIMETGNCDCIERAPYYHFDKPYIFLRDVDVEPIILESEEYFDEILVKSKKI